jgi:hypothetical protein
VTVRPLRSNDDRANFDCGDPALNTYLKTQASQDQKRRCALTHVAVLPASSSTVVGSSSTVVGYYTVANTAVPRLHVSEATKLPMYDPVPALLLARLGRDVTQKNTGLGEELIAHAIMTALTISGDHSGCRFILVDAYPHRVQWYSEFGFIPIPGAPPGGNVKMFLDLLRLPGALFGAVEHMRKERDALLAKLIAKLLLTGGGFGPPSGGTVA